ncbi:hypothetical protein DFH09DRAFT_1137088 [Mycena vulgaris]|nr:hypothetical protein DFH09DRAFT_1137088 [Mycena vulgaris]
MDKASFFLWVQVWGMFLQAAAFGIYTITCLSCFRAFFTARSHQRGLSKVNWPMLIVFIVFMAQAAASVSLHLYLNLEMSTADPDERASAEFLDGSSSINIGKSSALLVQTMISSAVLIYRCWVIHRRALLVVALPLVLWVGGVAVMGMVIRMETSVNFAGFLSISQARDFRASFWVILIVVNIITSGLIARRVWRAERYNSRPSFQTDTDQSTTPTTKNPSVCVLTGRSHERMKHATRTIIESGLIYTTMTIITFILFVANTLVVYAAYDMLVIVIGISFNLIVARNLPQSDADESLSHLNNLPLQFVSSNMSVPGSAIEFAYPKHYMPRRSKTRPPSPPAQEGTGAALRVAEATPTNHSRQSV